MVFDTEQDDDLLHFFFLQLLTVLVHVMQPACDMHLKLLFRCLTLNRLPASRIAVQH